MGNMLPASPKLRACTLRCAGRHAARQAVGHAQRNGQGFHGCAWLQVTASNSPRVQALGAVTAPTGGTW